MLSRPVLPLAAAALLLSLTACGGGSSSETAQDTATSEPSQSESTSSAGTPDVTCDYPADPQAATKKVNPPPQTPDVAGQVAVTMETSIGTINATLDADKTPCTVNSFVSLARQGFFDKTPCHRLTTAATGIFVLQCGDPSGTGTGGPGYTIPDELSGDETYGPGTLAMAKTDQPDSGGSQFFIVYKKTPLPPDYTVFGQVDAAGVKAVRKVARQGTDDAFGQGDGHPKVTVTLDSVSAG
ncbi:MAG TPA: peptidylprolyl isomerase [Nocardioides sp.]|nr:peptidylprolyl isomerase [Nocardioides sp.]